MTAVSSSFAGAEQIAGGGYRLPTEDFCALHLGPSNDELPAGITHLSRLETVNEASDYWRAARNHYANAQYQRLRELIGLFTVPKVRIVVYSSFAGVTTRVSAAWHPDDAALISQTGDNEFIRLRGVAPNAVPRAITPELGNIERGNQRYFTASAAELDEDGPYVFRSGPAPADEYRELFVRNRIGQGSAIVLGSPVGVAREFGVVSWFWIQDDGCYQEVRTDSMVTVTPVDAAGLAAALDRPFNNAAEDSSWD